MKKRVLAMAMALCLALSLLPVTAGAAENETVDWQMEYYDYTQNPSRPESNLAILNKVNMPTSFTMSKLSELFADDFSQMGTFIQSESNQVEISDPFAYLMDKLLAAMEQELSTFDAESFNKEAPTATDLEKLLRAYTLLETIQTAKENGEQETHVYLEPYVSRSANMATSITEFDVPSGLSLILNVGPKEDYSFTIDGAITVKNGGKLALEGSFACFSADVSLTDSITVEDGGLLVLNSGSTSQYAPDPHVYTATTDKPIIQVNEGGKAVLNAAKLVPGENSPAVVVDGGELVVSKGGAQPMGDPFLVFEDFGPNSQLGSVEVIATGEQPAIQVTSGSVTITGGVFAGAGEQPAIEVGANATIIIPENSDALISSTNGVAAISLANGAKAQLGGTVDNNGVITGATTTITAGTNSYIDNDGTVILGAGSTVTDSTGNTDQLPYGGTVSGDGTVTKNPDPTPEPDPTPSGSDNSEPSYSPVMDVSDGGTVRVNPRTPSEGDPVTLTVTPDSGYGVGGVTVTDRSGRGIDVTANRDGTYTFTQPRGRVTISVEFVREGGAAFFADVPETYWAYDEIAWASGNGYVNGTTATTFSPGASVSRQQVWMILARLSGADPADMAAARVWAVENGISDGTNPGTAVTRQQLAALLFRFAQSNGYDNGQRSGLSAFPDAGDAAAYAVEPLRWATAGGIISGTSQGTLNPAGTATRAQFTVMLYRFWTNV